MENLDTILPDFFCDVNREVVGDRLNRTKNVFSRDVARGDGKVKSFL